MRALVWDGQRLGVEEDVEVRAPGEGEVAVAISMAGLCHSDVSPMEGRIPVETPVILGHEAVGTVVGTGPGTGIPLGQRVVLTVLRNCGRCASCASGRPQLCRTSGVALPSPFSRHGEVVHQFVKLGAFAQRIVVPSSQVVPMPDGISDPVAAMIGCATVTGFGAVEHQAKLQPGESVLVSGAGGIGLNAVLAARFLEASRIIVVDRNPAKEQIARRCGATDFIVPESPAAIPDAVFAIEPDGVDAAFECAGNNALLAADIAALAWGGRAVIVGLAPTGSTIELPSRALFNDKAVMGTRMGSVDPHAFLPVLAQRVLDGLIDLEPLVSKVVPMEAAADLVTELHEGRLDRGFIEIGGKP